MESDNFSVSSRANSIDADRASLEAERQNLYDDHNAQQDTLSPDTIVQSPKTREIREQSRQYPTASRSRSAAPEILDAGPAPPDYFSATAGRSVQFPLIVPGFSSNSSYGATADTSFQAPEISTRSTEWHHTPEISHSPQQAPRSWFARILSSRNMNKPQLHVRNNSVHDERVGLITNISAKKEKKRKFCNVCFRISLVLGVILFLGLLFGVFDNQGGSVNMPSDDAPSKPPIGGDHGKDGYIPHPSTPQCPYASQSDPLQFDFVDPSHFTFTERIQYDDDLYGNIGGYIWLVSASDAEALDMESNVRVWVSVATTEPWKVQQVSHVRDDYGLEIKFPKLERTDPFGLGRSCMHIATVIMFKKDISLETFNITSTHLDVKGLDNLTESGLEIDETNVDLVVGDLSLHYWSSRETYLHTISGRITGEYALRDVLDVNTKSGNIDIRVDPKSSESGHKDTPATFSAKSVSGKINAIFPTSGDIPERIYKTTLTGISSVITGSYVFSALASLFSRSGNIKAVLLPYSSSSAGYLHSESISGNHDLTVLPAFSDPGTPINNFKSKHETVSGKVTLVYPQEWSGELEGSTMSGNVRLKGKDLVHDSDRGSIWGDFSAHKGKGHSHMEIQTLSGNVEATIGDL